MSDHFWMVRAGAGGYLVDEFSSKQVVAIGWSALPDLSAVTSLDQMRDTVASAYPSAKPGWLTMASGMVFKFVAVLEQSDPIVTYDPEKREYIVGKIAGHYRYQPGLILDFPHIRPVRWEHRVSRDLLSQGTRNTLGGIATLFDAGVDALAELGGVIAGRPGASSDVDIPTAVAPATETENVAQDLAQKAHERIKDQVLSLDESDLPDLVAAVLRSMGLRTQRGPSGSDRGRDVVASPDGLGLLQPRVIVEVKARPRETIGAPLVRSFLAALQAGDKGLYVATGGFSREANYEAERSSIPVTLINLDRLAGLIVENYDRFDAEGRALLPLTRFYWPTE